MIKRMTILQDGKTYKKTENSTVIKPNTSAMRGGYWSQTSHFRHLSRQRGEYIPGSFAAGMH